MALFGRVFHPANREVNDITFDWQAADSWGLDSSASDESFEWEKSESPPDAESGTKWFAGGDRDSSSLEWLKRLGDEAELRKLEEIREASREVCKELLQGLPFSRFSASRHPSFDEFNVEEVLGLESLSLEVEARKKPRLSDATLETSLSGSLSTAVHDSGAEFSRRTSSSLTAIRDAAELISRTPKRGQGKLIDLPENMQRLRSEDVVVDQELPWDVVTRQRITSYNVHSVLGLSSDAAKCASPREYLKLEVPRQASSLRPPVGVDGLSRVRQAAQQFVVEAIEGNARAGHVREEEISLLAKAVTEPDPLLLRKVLSGSPHVLLRDQLLNAFFWCRLLPRVWINVFSERFSSVDTWYWSYVAKFHGHRMPLQYVSRWVPQVSSSMHFVFTGFLHCGVPGIYRLLVRLNTMHYLETRINCLADFHGSADRAIMDPICAAALKYNIDGLAILWPYFLEWKEPNLQEVADRMFSSPLASSVASLIFRRQLMGKSNISMVASFMELLSKVCYSAHTAGLLKDILHRPPHLNFYFLIANGLHERANVYLAEVILLAVADIIFLSRLDALAIPSRLLKIMGAQIQKLTERTSRLMMPNLGHELQWVRLHSRLKALGKAINKMLQKSQPDLETLAALTSAFGVQHPSADYLASESRRNSRRGEFSSETGAAETPMSAFFRRAKATFPCWRLGCRKELGERSVSKAPDFRYCHRCSVASYCCNNCRDIDAKTHSLYCQKFARPPTFVTFQTLADFGVSSATSIAPYIPVDEASNATEAVTGPVRCSASGGQVFVPKCSALKAMSVFGPAAGMRQSAERPFERKL